MATYLPALRARFGTTEYFVSVLTLGEASRLLDYVEQVDGWTSETPSELKIQRKLNTQRVEREMVPYLTMNDDPFYSSLTVELRLPGEVTRTPDFQGQTAFPGGVEFGTLTLDGTEVLYALDGQHRLKSIELAIRQRPDLAREHIAIILLPFVDVQRSQVLFSDLNRNAKTPSKSVALLFSHRDWVARTARASADRCRLLRDRVNMETTSLSANSSHFITLSTLYEMARTLLPDAAPLDDLPPENETRFLDQFVDTIDFLSEIIPGWRMVRDDEEHPAYLRQREFSAHGVGQRALAEVAWRAQNAHGSQWKELLKGLSDVVDWRLTNSEWQGVALQGGRVNNTSTSIRLLADHLSGRLGLDSPTSTVDPGRQPVNPSRSRVRA